MDIDKLDFRKLRAFELVARQGNLRLAALRLNQSIPAISGKLRRLEEDLGVTLFERLPNKLILTESGHRFLAEVEQVFERAEQALATISPAGTQLTGRLSVSIGSDHSWFFAPRLSRFLKHYPGAELSLQVSRASDAIAALIRGELDIAIGIFPTLPKTLEAEVIVNTTLSLVCQHGHPLLDRRPPHLADLTRHRLIVLPRHAETRRLIDKVMPQSQAVLDNLIEVANCQTATTFVASGVGVAIVHSLCVEHAHNASEVGWVDLGQHFGSIDFSVVSRRGAGRSPLVNALLEELTEG